jgi:hypothetical protein
MKQAIFLAVAAVLLCAGSQPQRKKPVFAFMGDSTATQTTRTELADKPCVVTGRMVDKKMGRKMECGPSDPTTWNGEKFNFLSSTYWNGRLIRVVGAFDRTQHEKVRALLVRTYGKPQREGYQTMAERPDPFTYPETVWEFDGGRLKLESQTDDSAVLTFGFTVDYPPDIDDVISVPVE